MNSQTHSPMARLAAWSVHLFTSTGLIAGFLAILAIVAHEWQHAAYWLIVALIIDGIDGTFARLAKVQEVLPHVNGKMIDFVVDFANYAIIPAFFLYESNLITGPLNEIAAAIILLVSALYYGIDQMVSEDNYFIGFPVLWNVIVIFLVFITQTSSILNFGIIVFIGVLHFVPIKFAYPSQNKHAKIPSIVMSLVLTFSMGYSIYSYPSPPLWIKILANVSLLYFGILAIYDTYFRK